MLHFSTDFTSSQTYRLLFEFVVGIGSMYISVTFKYNIYNWDLFYSMHDCVGLVYILILWDVEKHLRPKRLIAHNSEVASLKWCWIYLWNAWSEVMENVQVKYTYLRGKGIIVLMLRVTDRITIPQCTFNFNF